MAYLFRALNVLVYLRPKKLTRMGKTKRGSKVARPRKKQLTWRQKNTRYQVKRGSKKFVY
jgi:hypothetical protein